MGDFTIFYPNPSDVEFRIKEAGWRYDNNRAGDFAFAKTPIVPALFQYVVRSKRVPTMGECVEHIWQWREVTRIRTDHDQTLAESRARKLVQDFYRELHTFGLLAKSNIFGSVRYAKAEDIDLGVDYTAALSLMLHMSNGNVGIQSAMRARWGTEMFTAIKAERRSGRNPGERWAGPIYWLTNKVRPHRNVAGVWLFTPEHIKDLIEEICGKKEESDIAIQLAFEL